MGSTDRRVAPVTGGGTGIGPEVTGQPAAGHVGHPATGPAASTTAQASNVCGGPGNH